MMKGEFVSKNEVILIENLAGRYYEKLMYCKLSGVHHL